MQLPLRQGDVHHTDVIDATDKIIAECADSETAAELVAMVNEREEAIKVIKLAQRWLANCVPVADLDGPKPMPVIAAFLKKAGAPN
jgi:hypothetical protein